MRSDYPEHELLEEARTLVEELASQPRGSRGAKVRARAEKRVERRADVCECPECELERAEARADDAADRAYDEWHDEQLERNVRPSE